jgi:hypothetical protein
VVLGSELVQCNAWGVLLYHVKVSSLLLARFATIYHAQCGLSGTGQDVKQSIHGNAPKENNLDPLTVAGRTDERVVEQPKNRFHVNVVWLSVHNGKQKSGVR